MNIFNALTLFGGLAMFLYGMRLMGDGLKEGASGTLKLAMERVTNNPFKAFLLGLAITALIQSSTATIVITSGLVGAGILTLHQSLGIIVGANVGTTVTGQIIRLLDVDASAGSLLKLLQPSSLAPMALILGIILIMAGKTGKSKTTGNIALGFGILFSGLMNMTSAVNSLTDSPLIESLFTGLGNNPFIGYLTGAGVAFVLQSSSATVGILQAFSQAGVLTWKAIYAVIVGIYLGDCVTTAIVCSIGAKAESRRVGIVHILFNIAKSVLVLGLVALLSQFGVLDGIWNKTVNSGIIANTNTIFNLGSAVVLFPFLSLFEHQSKKIVKDDKDETKSALADSPYREQIEALNPVFFTTPALALNSCYDILMAMFTASRKNLSKSLPLLKQYDEKTDAEIRKEEKQIDMMTDRVSHYLVEFLPTLHSEEHTVIVNQYYKVVAEFERLGDHAVNITNASRSMHENEIHFSEDAYKEIHIMTTLLDEILENAQRAFQNRDVTAAYRIEPLRKVAVDMLSIMNEHHFQRMTQGKCTTLADAGFINLLTDMHRIADICSNIGAATIIRTQPEIAEKEHTYYSNMHHGNDATFNHDYEVEHEKYFAMLDAIEG